MDNIFDEKRAEKVSTLVFSSFGFRSPIVRSKLNGVLDFCEKSVLIVPFAAFSIDFCITHEKNGLVRFGFDEDNIFCCEGPSSFDREYDYIYVPGGDTFKLLKTLQDMNLLCHIRRAVDNGSIYIGVSAGAELATCNLEYVKNLEDDNFSIQDFGGLSLVDEMIIPHSDQRYIFDKIHCMMTSDKGDRRLMEIPNDGVVIFSVEEGRREIKII